MRRLSKQSRSLLPIALECDRGEIERGKKGHFVVESNIPQSSAELSAEELSSKNVQHYKVQCMTRLPLIANRSRKKLIQRDGRLYLHEGVSSRSAIVYLFRHLAI